MTEGEELKRLYKKLEDIEKTEDAREKTEHRLALGFGKLSSGVNVLSVIVAIATCVQAFVAVWVVFHQCPCPK